MRKILVSVIVPAYNVASYLAQCLDSLITQTYKNLEIIIIDDASPDNSRTVALKYAERDARVKVVSHKYNQGAAVARNTGLDLAGGQYVHFVDGDDYLLEKDYYARILKVALRTNADMTASGIYWEARAKKYYVNRLEQAETLENKFAVVNQHIACWRYLYKRQFLDKYQLRFDAHLHYAGGEDTIFSVCTAYYADRIALVPQTTYFYRQNPCGICNTQDAALVKLLKNNNTYAWRQICLFSEKHNLSIEDLIPDWFIGEKIAV